MAKVFIYPATSLILSDLVARFGHKPLGTALSIRDRIQTAGVDSPPLQMTPEDPKRGLKFAAVEVPSGVRGRMSLFGPLIEDAEAAIIVKNADISFGCMGCARTDELVEFMIKERRVPLLELIYPTDEESGIAFVRSIRDFLKNLESGESPSKPPSPRININPGSYSGNYSGNCSGDGSGCGCGGRGDGSGRGCL